MTNEGHRDESGLRRLRAGGLQPPGDAPPRRHGFRIARSGKYAPGGRTAVRIGNGGAAAASEPPREGEERNFPVHGRRPESDRYLGSETGTNPSQRPERPRKYRP